MVERGKEHCKGINNIEFYCDNILLYEYEKADMIIAYYTIQFVPERYRQELFNKIYERLNWGGAFVLFEKVRAPDARFQDMMTALYHDFKSRNGFSHEEIAHKAASIRGVLDPFSTNGNIGLLNRAGFVDYMTIFKYVCFEGFLSIK
jgi:tRNA (cmo5U34)-methyltransferase